MNKSLRFHSGSGIVRQVRDVRPQATDLLLPQPPDPLLGRQPGRSRVRPRSYSSSEAHTSDAKPSSSPTTSRGTRPWHLFDSPDTGAGTDEIGARRKISRRRTEDQLHEHLRRLWVAPAEEFARLQIARLDAMILKLIGRIQDGDLEAMDRTLMIINSLDRLPGFVKVQRDEPCTEKARARLLQKLYDAAARLQSEPRVE